MRAISQEDELSVGDALDNSQINGSRRKGGCEIPSQPEEEEKSALEKDAEKLGLTPQKLLAMQLYAKALVKANPKIKPSKVRSKLAKKFNVQLT